MTRVLLLLLIFTALAVNAEVLKIGTAPADTQTMKGVGKFLMSEIDSRDYSSFKLITAKSSSTADLLAILPDSDILVAPSLTAAELTQEHSMEPLLLANKTGSVFMAAHFITRKDSGINNLKDLKGKLLVLANSSSTSFYYLPVKAFKNAGINLNRLETPDSELKPDAVNYYITGNIKDMVTSVYLKKADASALCSFFWTMDIAAPEFMKKSVRVFHTTDSLPGNFLLAKKSLPESIKNRIVNTLSKMNVETLAKHNIINCDIKSFHKIGFDWRTFLDNVRNFRG